MFLIENLTITVHVNECERFVVKRGFTLVEVLVSLSIVGILSALLLGGVQGARESARRAYCANNVRQLGLAVHMFHDRNRAVPSNGGPSADSYIEITGLPAVQPYTFELSTLTKFEWGVPDPGASMNEQPGSWLYSILPFVEQDSLFLHPKFDHVVGIYQCASRPRGPPSQTTSDQNGVYEGGGLAFSKSDYCANDLLVQNRPSKRSFRAVQDGLSQTILIGEKAFDFDVHLPTSWYWDEPFWLGGSKGTARSGSKVIQDGRGILFKHNWGAAHSSGAHFCFSDGRTTLMSNTVEEAILAAALTIDQSEVVKPIE